MMIVMPNVYDNDSNNDDDEEEEEDTFSGCSGYEEGRH